MSFSQGGTAVTRNPALEFGLNHNISMHNWRRNMEALIFIIEGYRGIKCVINVFIRQHMIIVLVLNKELFD